jgi:hypothetical protein
VNVRLVQLDGKLPNLALMKLSSYHKGWGHKVYFTRSPYRDLFEPDFDAVYGSSIFTRSQNTQNIFMSEFPNAILAGTGTSNTITVEDLSQSENLKPDYSLYPWFKSSIGFSQRGCRLKCGFCVVPKKEGRVKDVNSIREIWRGEGHPKQIHLLDNDFFGQPNWEEKCDEIEEGNFKICLNQGINVRLIHEKGAIRLAKLKYYDDQFKQRRIYTAWDNAKDEKIFNRGIGYLLQAGIKPRHIMVYMLVGYWPNETIEDVFYRFNKLKDLGVMPYPMVFDEKNKQLKKFQRWVIRRYYQFVKWEDYCK